MRVKKLVGLKWGIFFVAAGLACVFVSSSIIAPLVKIALLAFGVAMICKGIFDISRSRKVPSARIVRS
jgi:hypothetical protein